jgi:hypothetical protein
METERKLMMYFKDEDDNKLSLNVDNPRYDIEEKDIKECMELIVQKNIFEVNGLNVVSCESAKIVETDTTEYDLVL